MEKLSLFSAKLINELIIIIYRKDEKSSYKMKIVKSNFLLYYWKYIDFIDVNRFLTYYDN